MTGSPRPLVAVVIVGFNNRDLLTDCLESLTTMDYRPILVVYVDNASTDGSLELVSARFPAVVSLSSGGNLGYCGGNNVGIRVALENGADYVLILNPDTVVCNPAFLNTLVDYLERHPRIGKVGPRVYLRQPGSVQNTVLPWPSVTSSLCDMLGVRGGRQRHVHSEMLTAPTEVPALNGCCLLVRSQAIREVGGYDGDFWGYMDEVDWDWRADTLGWRRYYVPVDSIIHLQKSDGYDFGSRADFLIKRNTAAWYLKTRRLGSLAAWMASTLAVAMARAGLAPLRGGSFTKQAGFVGRLAAAYGRILVAVPGRLLGRETRWCA